MSTKSEEKERHEALEERLIDIERELAAIRWALGVTPDMAELSKNFEEKRRDHKYRG